jgi:hypothetical protein
MSRTYVIGIYSNFPHNMVCSYLFSPRKNKINLVYVTITFVPHREINVRTLD